MKSDKKILVAFLLNLFFSIFEFFGGAFTGSVAIISDAVHDLGDSISIGLSYLLEKISKKAPDDKYTYGYLRYSVLGGLITTLILASGSVMVIFKAVERVINPVEINYSGMIIFAVIGVTVNIAAAIFTRNGDSLNQKAVSLHMLEDVLGWIVVLFGAIIMRFTDFYYIDSVMSVCVAIFILINAFKNLKTVADIFLEKIPEGINYNEIEKHLKAIDGVSDIHHLHIRSIDGFNNVATLHVVCKKECIVIKEKIREELHEHGIVHATVETEKIGEICNERSCKVFLERNEGHGHHHHHGHHH